MASEPTLGTALPARIGVFDTETDGIDLEDTRIITAFLGVMDTSTREVVERYSWVLQPERPIPKVASDVHGYSTERARAEGVDRHLGIMEIADKFIEIGEAMPIVAMNAIYDLTILDREVARIGLTDELGSPWEIVERDETGAITWPIVFDPMVFDRAIDKFRKGKRTLVDLCRVYGVPVEVNAHDAEADCRMAGRVAIVLLGHSRLLDLTMSEVHRKLIATHRTNSLSLADYWQKGLNRLSAEERAAKVEAIKEVRDRAGLWPCLPRL